MIKKNIISYIVISLSFHFSASMLNADGTSLFKEIINANTGIKTIDSDIIQYINTPEHSKEVFKGKYIADDEGRFRIEYALPSRQIVLSEGNIIYWYYPEDNLLYIIGRNKISSKEPKLNPLQEFSDKDFGKRFTVDYLGKKITGLFSRQHRFIVHDTKGNLEFEINADPDSKVLLSKTVRNKAGMEIIKEIYGNYSKIENVNFPGRIDVYARTETGVIRNTTEYKNIRLNYSIPENFFRIKFPDNVKKKYIQ